MKQRNHFWKKCRFDIVVLSVVTIIVTSNFNLSNISSAIMYHGKSAGESFTTDLFFRISNSLGSPEMVNEIKIIDIDKIKSRKKLARLFSRILKMNPRKVGVDIIFRGKTTADDDSVLLDVIDTLKTSKKFVFVNEYTSSNKTDFVPVLHSFFFEKQDKESQGFSNLIYDPSFMTVRQYRREKQTSEGVIRSLAFQMAYSKEYKENDISSPLQYIDFRKCSFPDINADSLNPEEIKDSWLLIGSLSKSHDNYNTPIGMMPGVMIHAYTLKTILYDRDIVTVGAFWEWFFLIIVSFMTCLLFVYSDFLAYYSSNKIKSKLIQQGTLVFILMFVQISLMLFIAYLIFEFFNVFFSMQGALNGSICVAAIIKSLYIIIMTILAEKNKILYLTNYSFYYSSNKNTK